MRPTYVFRQPQYIRKKWGYEVCMCNIPTDCKEKGYACKTLTLLPSVERSVDACSIHFHERKHETFWVTRGRFFLEIYLPKPGQQLLDIGNFEPPKQFCMHPGTVVTLEPTVAHRFFTIVGVTTVIEASSPDSPADSIRLTESGPVPIDTSKFTEVKPDGIVFV